MIYWLKTPSCPPHPGMKGKQEKEKKKIPDVADQLQQTYVWHPESTQLAYEGFLHQLNSVLQIFSKLDNPMHSICATKIIPSQ